MMDPLILFLTICVMIFPLVQFVFFIIRKKFPAFFANERLFRSMVIALLVGLIIMPILTGIHLPRFRSILDHHYQEVPEGYIVSNPNLFTRTKIGALIFGLGTLLGGLVIYILSIYNNFSVLS